MHIYVHCFWSIGGGGVAGEKTHVERVIRGYAAGAGGGAKGCAGDLVPGAEVAVEVEVWVWDGVETGSVVLGCSDGGRGGGG